MSSNRLLVKDDLQDNHLVGHSVMNPVDAMVFQKRKVTREGNYESSKNFEMEFLDKGSLDKALMVPEKATNNKQPRKKIYEVIENNYFEQYDVKFTNSSYQN